MLSRCATFAWNFDLRALLAILIISRLQFELQQNFKATRDPDFSDALLLEQHQAPIAAALTPAFSADSTPEVLAAAVQVCAVFVGSGVVREVERMGRILKLLTASLDNCMGKWLQFELEACCCLLFFPYVELTLQIAECRIGNGPSRRCARSVSERKCDAQGRGLHRMGRAAGRKCQTSLSGQGCQAAYRFAQSILDCQLARIREDQD